MKCVKCGQQLVEGAAFCMFCGTKAGKICPKCGQELPDIAMFCYKCGANLNAPTKLDEKSKGIDIDAWSKAMKEAEAAGVFVNNTLDDNTMNSLQKVKSKDDYRPTGDPVWNRKPDGTRCDCAVGECDCDGSIWS